MSVVFRCELCTSTVQQFMGLFLGRERIIVRTVERELDGKLDNCCAMNLRRGTVRSLISVKMSRRVLVAIANELKLLVLLTQRHIFLLF